MKRTMRVAAMAAAVLVLAGCQTWRGSTGAVTGVVTLSNGARYEGDWRDGKRHGKGVFTKPDGYRYEGEYRAGKAHGKGVETWPDGWS